MNTTIWIVLGLLVLLLIILIGVAIARRSKSGGAHAQEAPRSGGGRAAAGVGAAGAAGAAGVAGASAFGKDDQDKTGDVDADAQRDGRGDRTADQDRGHTAGGQDSSDAPTEAVPTLSEDSDKEYFGADDDVRAPHQAEDDATATTEAHQEPDVNGVRDEPGPGDADRRGAEQSFDAGAGDDMPQTTGETTVGEGDLPGGADHADPTEESGDLRGGTATGHGAGADHGDGPRHAAADQGPDTDRTDVPRHAAADEGDGPGAAGVAGAGIAGAGVVGAGVYASTRGDDDQDGAGPERNDQDAAVGLDPATAADDGRPTDDLAGPTGSEGDQAGADAERRPGTITPATDGSDGERGESSRDGLTAGHRHDDQGVEDELGRDTAGQAPDNQFGETNRQDDPFGTEPREHDRRGGDQREGLAAGDQFAEPGGQDQRDRDGAIDGPGADRPFGDAPDHRDEPFGAEPAGEHGAEQREGVVGGVPYGESRAQDDGGVDGQDGLGRDGVGQDAERPFGDATDHRDEPFGNAPDARRSNDQSDGMGGGDSYGTTPDGRRGDDQRDGMGGGESYADRHPQGGLGRDGGTDEPGAGRGFGTEPTPVESSGQGEPGAAPGREPGSDGTAPAPHGTDGTRAGFGESGPGADMPGASTAPTAADTNAPGQGTASDGTAGPGAAGAGAAGAGAAGAGVAGAGATGAGPAHKVQDLRHKVQDQAKERWNRPGADGQTPGDKFGQLRDRVEGEVRNRMQNRSSGQGQGNPDGTSGNGLKDRVEDGIRRFRRGGDGASGQ